MKNQLARKRPPFTMIENAIIEDEGMSPYELLVYMVICYHADREGKAFPSIRTIARETHLSAGTVQPAIKGLIEKGYLLKEIRLKPNSKERMSNLYTVVSQYEYSKRQGGGVSPRSTPVSRGETGGVSPRSTEQDSSSEQDSKNRRNPPAPPACATHAEAPAFSCPGCGRSGPEIQHWRAIPWISCGHCGTPWPEAERRAG